MCPSNYGSDGTDVTLNVKAVSLHDETKEQMPILIRRSNQIDKIQNGWVDVNTKA